MRRAQELGDEVAVGAVQLHAVEAGLARPPGAFGKRGHGLFDVRHRHPLALKPVQRVAVVGGAQAELVLDAADVTLPAGMAQLEDEAAIVLVHRLADGAPERNPLVAVDRGVVRHDPPANQHRHERRDDRAHAAARELHFPVDARLVPGPVVVVEAARDVGAEDAVLDGQVSERERFEDDVGHAYLSWPRGHGSSRRSALNASMRVTRGGRCHISTGVRLEQAS